MDQPAKTVTRRGRIFEAKASAANPAGVTLAEAWGKNVPPPNLPPMQRELAGDWRWLLEPPA